MRGDGPGTAPVQPHGKEVRQRMIPGRFDYVRPATLDEALRILRDREGEAKILSGGYSLIRSSSCGSPSPRCSSTSRP